MSEASDLEFSYKLPANLKLTLHPIINKEEDDNDIPFSCPEREIDELPLVVANQPEANKFNNRKAVLAEPEPEQILSSSGGRKQLEELQERDDILEADRLEESSIEQLRQLEVSNNLLKKDEIRMSNFM